MGTKTATLSQLMQEEGGVHTKSSDLDKISASYQSLHLSENQQVSKLNTVK